MEPSPPGPSLSKLVSLRPSRSNFIQVQGLRLHVRSWGDEGAPRLFLLHGWLDCSASFQFMADALAQGPLAGWQLLAPDWRGYGLSQWAGPDYRHPDLLADLHHLLRHFQPDQPVHLLGHSMGAALGGLYAGAQPGRVASFMNIEGYGITPQPAVDAPQRLQRWLTRLDQRLRWPGYASFEQLAQRLRRNNRLLTQERSLFLARHLGQSDARGRVRLRCDPRHKDFFSSPAIYRLEDIQACWRAIRAPVLWVETDDGSPESRRARLGEAAIAARKACFAHRRDAFIADTGHQVHIERPERLAEEVAGFLSAAAAS